MRGREERDEQKREMTKRKLEGYPAYMQGYFNYLYDKTENTKYNYITNVTYYLSYLKKNGKDISNIKIFNKTKPSDINAFVYGLNGKDAKKLNMYYALLSFYQYLENDEIISRNPVEKASKPRQPEQKDPVVLSKSEIKRLLYNIQNPPYTRRCIDLENRKKFKNMNTLITILALETGLREGSLCEINVGDINFEDRYITVVQKGKTTHHAYFGEEIVELIETWLEERQKILADMGKDTEALFITVNGERLYPLYFDKMLKWAAAGIDKPISPHKLRSTCATHIYDKTSDIYLTAQILGHANIRHTRRYAKMPVQKERSASNIMEDVIFSQ